MALVNCRECGKQISDQAAACPHCGFPMDRQVAPPPSPPPVAQSAPAKRSGCGTLLLAGLVGLVILVVLGQCAGPKKSTPAPASNVAEPAKPVIAEAAKDSVADGSKLQAAELLAKAKDRSRPTAERLANLSLLTNTYPSSPEALGSSILRTELETLLHEEQNPVGRQWSYVVGKDDMSGKDIRSASVTSSNSFQFEFPYNGTQHATLQLRRHPRWGNDVMFSVERGQILCHSFSECPIRVRFDDEAPKTFHGNEPSDNSSELVFIPGFDSFAKKLEKAKRVRIEVNVYHQGTLMAEFDVSGFDRKRLSH